MALSGVIGVVGLRVWPFPADNAFLALVAARRPTLSLGLAYAYATVWFSTPLLILNVAASLGYIFVARLDRPATPQPLPPYPAPEHRAAAKNLSAASACASRSSEVSSAPPAAVFRYSSYSSESESEEDHSARCSSPSQ